MGGSAAERLPFDGVVADVIRDAIEATRTETSAQVRASPDSVELRRGHPVGSSGSDRLWSFELDIDVAPLPETPGKLLVEGLEPLSVRVLAVGDGTLVLGVREELGEAVPGADLSLSAAFVHEALVERLEEAMLDGEVDGDLMDALLLPDLDELDHDGLVPLDPPEARTADEEQQRAASRSIEPGLRFTWGPPGTGKTRVLAMAVAEAVERGDRVLVLAHANAAVDVAVARVADQLVDTKQLAGGQILRIGTPHLPIALDCHQVLPDRILARRHPELVQRRDVLSKERRDLSNALRSAAEDAGNQQLSRRLTEVRAELAQITQELRNATVSLIDDAAVVTTTLARLVIDSQLWRWPADVVIVDEASMAGLPFILALATRGASSLSFFGDFRQLPPVAVSDAESARQWFARDVFEYAGVVEAHEQGRADARLSVLRTQFRMGEQICETINQFAYDGLLITDRSARNRAIRVAERWPSPGVELVVVDTSSLGGGCLTEPGLDAYSRFAPLSAALGLTLAESMVGDGSVDLALISPYRAQTALFASGTRDLTQVTAATIHRFQGSERDVVLLDLVDGPDQLKASRLTGGDPELSLRLLNVAASRARGKLIILADLTFIDEVHPLNSSARLLLECAAAAGAETIEAGDLVAAAKAPPDPAAGPRVRWYTDWAGAAEDLGGEIATASEVDLHLPDVAFGGDWLGPALGDRQGSPLPVLRVSSDLARGFAAESADVRLLTTGPAPWAIIDEKVLWVGSRSLDQPVARVDGALIVGAFRRLVTPGK
jgi:hypothetical protein